MNANTMTHSKTYREMSIDEMRGPSTITGADWDAYNARLEATGWYRNSYGEWMHPVAFGSPSFSTIPGQGILFGGSGSFYMRREAFDAFLLHAEQLKAACTCGGARRCRC